MRRTSIGLVLTLLLPVSQAEASTTSRHVFTVADGIESTRAMTDQAGNAISYSPDGRSYALMLVHGDIKKNGVWADIEVGSVGSAASEPPHLCARLFSSGLGSDRGMGVRFGTSALTQPWSNIPHWVDNNRIALLWSDARGIVQAVNIDARSGTVHYLTKEPRDVTAFVQSGNAILYDEFSELSSDRSQSLLRGGFTLRGLNAVPVLAGLVDGTRIFEAGRVDRKLERIGSKRSFSIPGKSFFQISLVSYGLPLISPNGRYAIINVGQEDPPEAWDRYSDPTFSLALKDRRTKSGVVKEELVQELRVVDLQSGATRRLWDAPFDPQTLKTLAWSPDSKWVALSRTFLPPMAQLAGGRPDNIVAVNVETGQYRLLPNNPQRGEPITINWSQMTAIQVEYADQATATYTLQGGSWVLSTNHGAADTRSSPALFISQSENDPPELSWRNPKSGLTKKLLDFDPQLRTDFLLGHVRFIRWRDKTNQLWEGRLYLPAAIRPGQRYPLVIQTHGFAPREEYSIYGPGRGAPGLGPGWSIYLAQSLAGAGIAVLQTGKPVDTPIDPHETPEQFARVANVWSSAAHSLAQEGLVDPSRVGIEGHSVDGRYVEYAISHDNFGYAAAIVADAAVNGYFVSTLFGWPLSYDEYNGSEPFGSGLKGWLETAPAFAAGRIQTPLQIETTSGFPDILFQWEMYSRLKRLNKPVEYYILPDIRHGSHIIQNPRQLLALQTRAFDWWRYWLKGEEDSNPQKREQYEEWHRLRALHNVDLKAPRPPELIWSSRARDSN